MIQLITQQAWASSPELRSEVFAFRHRVFRTRLGWDVNSYDKMEFDEFDALLPIYMLARDEAGTLRGLWRLLPTTGPYMLRNVFSYLLDGRPAPRREETWEISRFAFSPASFGRDGIWAFNQITCRLLCSLCEFGLERGITEVVGVYDRPLMLVLKRLGCAPNWMSEPRKIGNTQAIAASYDITAAALRNLQKQLAPQPSTRPDYRKERKAA